MLNIPGSIPVRVHPLFWLIAFLIGWMWSFQLVQALLCVAVIMFSVLFHEYGHALTAIMFGQKSRIELAAFGGFTYREGKKLKLWQEFLVVLDGPLAGLGLGLLAYWIFITWPPQQETWAFLLSFTFKANFFWTLVNMLPVLPLDGGHLLSILLEAIFGFKGIRLAIIVGLIFSILFSILFLFLGAFLVAALFCILAFEGFRSLRYYKIFSEKDRDADLQKMMQEADKAFQEEKVSEALEKLENVRQKTGKGLLYLQATQELAQLYQRLQRYEEAYHLLLPLEKDLTGESLALLHALAYRNKDYKKAVALGDQCYQDNPSAHTALLNALSHGALQHVEATVGWLECAIREGLSQPREAMARAEFDSIRDTPAFQDLSRRHLSS